MCEDMSAKVIVNQKLTEPIGVCNGLCQGPVLYFGAVADNWRNKCSAGGVEFWYKHGHKLIGDRTAKSWLLLDIITESQFANATALYATSEVNFVAVAQSFVGVAI